MSELIELLMRVEKRQVEAELRQVEMIRHQIELEKRLNELLKGKDSKEFYTPKEFAELTGRNADYIRQMCRAGRIACKRTNSGRGNKPELRIGYEELVRFQREGLRPENS
jgi:hypothetical protein